MTRDGPPTEPDRILPPKLVWVVLVAAGLVCAYYVGVKGSNRSAFIRWRPQIAELVRGEDAYTKYGFPTPPIMALLLAPLAVLPAQIGMSAWLFIKVVLTLVALRWLIENQRAAWGQAPRAAVPALALLASATPIIADLLHGNINLWILFLVVAAWRAFRVGRKVLAGAVFSLAVACKVTPALLVIYMAWKREWRVTAAACAGLFVWLLVVPAIWFGGSRNLELLDRWSGLMLRPYVVDGRAEQDERNQSLAGLFQRLTSAARVDGRPTEEALPASRHAINVVSLSPQASRWAWRAIAAFAVAGLWWITRFPTRQTDRRWLEHEFALVLLAMLLLSERSWKHHYVTVLPSFVTLSSWIRRRSSPGESRSAVIFLTACAAGLPVVASQDVLGPLAGDAVVERLQAYGVYVWSACLLIAAHLLVRRDFLSRGRIPTAQ